MGLFVNTFVNLQAKRYRMEKYVYKSRAEAVFQQFLLLLSEHHVRERSVGFYAARLCLSQKYFSRLVKEASGQGAPA